MAAYNDTTTVNYQAPQVAQANSAPTQSYQNAINAQLRTLSQPTDPNSPTVRAQTDAFHLSNERNLGQNERQLAEQAYAGGQTNSGGYDQMVQRARENAALAEGQNTGNVMATAEAQRLAQQQALLGLGTSASLQQQGIDNQANQFGAQLGLNYNQLGEAHNTNAGNLDLQNRTLAQNQAQFGVTSAQNQQAINNALKIAEDQNALGYYNADINNNGANYRAQLGIAGQ